VDRREGLRLGRGTRGGLLLAALVTSALALAGCGSSSTDASNAANGPFHGVDMRARSMTLTTADLAARFRSTQGRPTDLATLGSGHLMLVYFGYTHCPDVCPTTMASIASAVHQLSQADQQRVRVVFVTSDPERDTPPVMRAWLSNFDGGLAQPFVGLTASSRQIDAVAKTLDILIAPPVKHKNGTITVEHGAETIAFDDHRAQVLWSSDTPAPDYAADLARLLSS
jgi:protein SCO1/2